MALNNLMQFLQSPQAMGMAQGLLSASGWSPRPMSISEGLGRGLMGAQQAGQQQKENEYRNSLLGLKQQEQERREMEAQAKMEAMRQQQEMAAKKMAMAEAQQQQQQQAMGNIADLIGTPGQAVEDVQVPLQRQQGAGLLGGQIDQQEFMHEAAKNLLGAGDYKTALGLLSPQGGGDLGQPKPIIDPRTGQPALAQFDKQGNMQIVEDALPMPQKEMQINTNPDGSVSYRYGVPQGAGKEEGLGKATENTIKGKLLDAQDQLRRAKKVTDKFDRRYFSDIEAARRWGLKHLSRNLPEGAIGEKNEKYLEGAKKMEHEIERMFHVYLNSIVGQRPAIQMYEILRETFPNMDLAPAEFHGVMEILVDDLDETIKTLNAYMKQGEISPEAAQEYLDSRAMATARRVADRAGIDLNEAVQEKNDPDNLRQYL